jgi:hypothetical protein
MDPHLIHNYYWEVWQHRTLAAGVAAPLAQLGRDLMRDYYHNYRPGRELGDESHGEEMLAMCLADPLQAELRFRKELGPKDPGFSDATAAGFGLL